MEEKEEPPENGWIVKDGVVKENKIISLGWQQLVVKKISRLSNQFLL